MSARPRYAWENTVTHAAPVVDQTKVFANNGAVNTPLTSAATPAMTTTKPCVIVVLVTVGCFENATPPTPPFCTGVTGGGLTFVQRGTSLVFNAGTQSQQEFSVWWANAPSNLNAVQFTAAFQNLSGVNNFFTGVDVRALSILGCKNPASPWDTNASLPYLGVPGGVHFSTDKTFDLVLALGVNTVANNFTAITGPGTWTVVDQSGYNPGGGAIIGQGSLSRQAFPATQSNTGPLTYTGGSGNTINYVDALVGI